LCTLFVSITFDAFFPQVLGCCGAGAELLNETLRQERCGAARFTAGWRLANEDTMLRVLAIYGSPRRNGNTSLLLKRAVEGARESGAEVDEVVLRDLNMSPCLEIYGCKKTGRCVIKDDFQQVYDQLMSCDGLMLASPIFFYTVSAHTKILMDRCQSLWVKKYWIEKEPFGKRPMKRKGLFISVGATRGKKLFDGALLTVRYFFDPLDMELWNSLLYRGLDFEGDVLKHPEYLEEAYHAGKELGRALAEGPTG
jgi:multimeric flavodoxin WrbA